MADMKKILVVDDTKTIRAMIRSQLEQSFEVFEAESGEQALELIKTHDFTLMTMDLEMPGMDGLETLQEIRKLKIMGKIANSATIPIPVIMITSDISVETHRKCFAAGANAFVNKPFGEHSLYRAVSGVILTTEVLSSSTIMVVNSGRTARAIVRVFLESTGANVREAPEGTSALELLKTEGTTIDLVITEQELSELSGMDLAIAIKQIPEIQGIPVIIAAEPSDQHTVADLYNSGASDYLQIPFSKEELVARARGQLEAYHTKKLLIEKTISDKKKSNNREILIGGFIHDLKSPLTVLSGYVNMIMKKEFKPETCAKYIPKMESQLETMKALAKDMVQSIRSSTDGSHDADKFEDISITKVIQDSMESLEFIAENKGVTLEFETNVPDMPNIFGDSRKLFRVFCNLLSNSIKFTPKDGTIKFEIFSVAKVIMVTITDTGVGIPANVIPTLFESFTEASRSGTDQEPGTGLGLSIVKEIVQIHAGRIEVKSEEGKGTVFTIKIPKLEEKIAVNS